MCCFVDGATFKQIDPTTVFPTADGGLCCDQVVIYDPNTDLFFWIMQYWAGSTGNNRERIAYAHPAALVANFNSWTYFDLTNGLFNSKGSLDYPDIAMTNQFLYMSVDGNDKNGKNGGSIVARMPLYRYHRDQRECWGGYLSPNETTDQGQGICVAAYAAEFGWNVLGAGMWIRVTWRSFTGRIARGR